MPNDEPITLGYRGDTIGIRLVFDATVDKRRRPLVRAGVSGAVRAFELQPGKLDELVARVETSIARFGYGATVLARPTQIEFRVTKP